MGKYKQWLHHQEIGRRLRDQIAILEQERARVQQMAPAHLTNLPELENPVIAALVNYTRQGNTLSDIDVIKAAMPDIGTVSTESDQRRPAPSAAKPAAQVGSTAVPVAPAPPVNDAVVASLLARAEQMPSDPLEQMRHMARSREQEQSSQPTASSAAGTSPGAADSVEGWWQRHRADDQE